MGKTVYLLMRMPYSELWITW